MSVVTRLAAMATACVGLPCGVAAAAAAADAAPDRPPNVVLILADDLGYADLGCSGGPAGATPALDRLAAAGTRFTSCYVAQAVCTASRAGLLTGCYPNRIGMAGALNHTSPTGIHGDERLLSELLKERGYATAAFGKWHLGHHQPFWPTRRGFNEFFGIPYSNDNGPLHPVARTLPPLPLHDGNEVVEIDPDQSQFTRRFTDRAVRFIERHARRPFFLYVPHVMPHVPIFASAEWHGKTGRGPYADVVAELDASVGEIVAALDRHGLAGNTLVIFASDNGPFLSYGNHAGSAAPLREGKLTAFEGGMRVPCIVRWPGHVPAGRVSDEMLSTLDLFTSMARLAGAALPERKTDGLDLTPLLLGTEGATGRDTFLFYAGDELHAVRQGRWKLHVPHDYPTVSGPPGRDGQPARPADQAPQPIAESGVRGIASRHGYSVASLPTSLYDLDTDPGETHDVAADHPDVVARLEAVATAARADLGDSLTGAAGRGRRPAGDARHAVPEGVKRIADIEYAVADKPVPMALLLDLYLPADAADRPTGDRGLPILLWIHGGGWKHGTKERCQLAWLAAEGWAVASIDYRLSWQACMPAQLDDCRAAIAWLRREAATYGLDPDRLFVGGSSAGGHLAALIGTAGTGAAPVQGVIDLFGPSDFASTIASEGTAADGEADGPVRPTVMALLGGPGPDLADRARSASPLSHVSADDPPFLILHGDADRIVPVEQSRRLDAALRAAGVASTLMVLPGVGHSGAAFFKADAPRQAMRRFLDRPVPR
jgi:arylsulfatase